MARVYKAHPRMAEVGGDPGAVGIGSERLVGSARDLGADHDSEGLEGNGRSF